MRRDARARALAACIDITVAAARPLGVTGLAPTCACQRPVCRAFAGRASPRRPARRRRAAAARSSRDARPRPHAAAQRDPAALPRAGRSRRRAGTAALARPRLGWYDARLRRPRPLSAGHDLGHRAAVPVARRDRDRLPTHATPRARSTLRARAPSATSTAGCARCPATRPTPATAKPAPRRGSTTTAGGAWRSSTPTARPAAAATSPTPSGRSRYIAARRLGPPARAASGGTPTHPYKSGPALASDTLLATLLYQLDRLGASRSHRRGASDLGQHARGFSSADGLYAGSNINPTPVDYIEGPLIYAQALLCRLTGSSSECELRRAR